MIFLTQSSVPILGQIAVIMGWIMNGIYKVMDMMGIQNIGLCIIVFSIIVYALMTPLQIKQQKFSKLQAIMQPELNKVQKKYKGKKDQESMQRMQEETQAVYAKYGVSPTGSCLQLLIQMPVLLSLYQVIYRIPGYVGAVKDVFTEAVNQIVGVNGYTELIQTFIADNKISRVQLALDEAGKATSNGVVDFLYALTPAQWKDLSSMKEFSAFSGILDTTAEKISKMQNFLGMNIADNPLQIIKDAWVAGTFILVIAAVLIPLLAWLTQVISIKLMPQPATQQSGDSTQDSMQSSMKMMNNFMPIMSAVFCFSFPVGLGIYWIASAVVRSIQMLFINKKLDNIDMDKLIEDNVKKMEKKREKKGLPPQKITNQAHQNVKNIEKKTVNNAERQAKVEEAYKRASNARPGSIASKANMVRDFDERNKKK